MPIPFFLVDAFTAEPFTGNPAGVCLLTEPVAEAWMQGLAREVKASETAFLLPREDGYQLRWFTPTVEVELCGHATLASAHTLWESGVLALDEIARFNTLSGLLTATRQGEWIQLDFPAVPIVLCDPPSELAAGLGGVNYHFAGKNRFDYLVELEDEEAVRSLKPDLPLLSRLQERGVIVTARATGKDYDFVSRFFAPGIGIPEDPVTGSAHCALGPYWAARLGKQQLLGRQLSARGGLVRVQPKGDRVLLGGQAVTVIKGEVLGL